MPAGGNDTIRDDETIWTSFISICCASNVLEPFQDPSKLNEGIPFSSIHSRFRDCGPLVTLCVSV